MELALPWGHSANLDVASGEQGDRRPGWPVCRIAKSYPGRAGVCGGGKPGQPLPQGPAWAPLLPSQHLHQSILGLKVATLKMGTSCQGEPDARGGGQEAPQLDGSELWSRGQTSPRPAHRHHLLAAWPARPVSSLVAWARTGHPPDLGGGRRPSIYWRFLDGAAKGKARSRLIPKGGRQGREHPRHRRHAGCRPKGRGEDGPSGGRRLLRLQGPRCHSERPANHLVQRSRTSPTCRLREC